MIPSRRRFLFGAGATLLAAPAIVRAASLMAIKPLPPAYGRSPLVDALPDFRELQRFRVILTSNPVGRNTWLNLGDTVTVQGVYARL